MKLTMRDEMRLNGLDGRLVSVVRRAAEQTQEPFMVLEGLRTHERQLALYRQGRETPGPVVTWTMESKHLHGLAVDLCPLLADGSIPWKDVAAFDRLATLMIGAGHQLGTAIRWGGDWDQDGKRREKGETDSPHFELAS